MTLRGCAREREIWGASASGRWTSALEAHARDCAPCAEVRLVTETLRAAAAPVPAAVDAGVLWFCARHIRRARAMSRMEMVAAAGQISALLVVLGVTLSLVDWPALLQFGRSWSESVWVALVLTVALVGIGLSRFAHSSDRQQMSRR